MGLESSSDEQHFPPLTVVNTPGIPEVPGNIINIADAAAGILESEGNAQNETGNFKIMLSHYSKHLEEFYNKNGSPQTTEGKITLIESTGVICTPLCSILEEKLQILEFYFLWDRNKLTDRDMWLYCT
ncbi:hypothetical protein KBB89_00515 [Candidatus Gracilibacteria bacterium]|nr:hypothetical protein [Candidatus Gracilibacteria bacterium]